MSLQYIQYPFSSSSGGALSIGTIDSVSPNANGAVISANTLFFQSASATFPGLVNLTTQSFAGNKTFTGTISASNLSGTNTGDVTLGTANGLGLAGQVLSLQLSSATLTGALSTTDWNTFNSKQAAGNYLTALTGDVVATGPGSVSSTIQSNVVTNTKLAQMATLTIKGNNTGGASNALDLTVAQTNAMLPVFTSTLNGLAPLSGGGTSNYLRADGSWATPPAGTGTVTSVAMTVPSLLSISGSPITTAGTLALTYSGTALPIANGGTAVTSVTTSPTATSFAGWDVNKNLSANNQLSGYTTTATSAGTTSLVITDTQLQYFTGSTTHTVKLPVVSGLVLGFSFTIVNLSTGIVTVQSSGANAIQAMTANTSATFRCILTSGTTASSWNAIYSVVASQMPALTGDVTTSAGAVATTIAANAVTNAKAAQMATLTIKGNNTGSTANAIDLTIAQTTAILQTPLSLITSITTTATIAATASLILASTTGGAYTATFPVPTGNTNKSFIVTKTTSDVTVLTLAIATSGNFVERGASSATTSLNTVGESLEFISDGTNYQVVRRTISSVWVTYTPSVVGGNAGAITNQTSAGYWRRVGDTAEIRIETTFSAAPGNAVSGILWQPPSGLTIDTTKMNSTQFNQVLGTALASGIVQHGSNDTGIIVSGNGFVSNTVQAISNAAGNRWAAAAPWTWASTDIAAIQFWVPITGWAKS